MDLADVTARAAGVVALAAGAVARAAGAVGLAAGAVALVAGSFHLGGPMPGGYLPAGLMLLAAAVFAGVLARLLIRGRFAAVTIASARAVALRGKSRHTVYLRQQDPGAAGRVRPRAPSARPTAA